MIEWKTMPNPNTNTEIHEYQKLQKNFMHIKSNLSVSCTFSLGWFDEGKIRP